MRLVGRTTFALALLVATALFVAPFQVPGASPEEGGTLVPLDKIGHVVVLAALGLHAGKVWPDRRGSAYALLVLFAALIEGVQAFLPWRSTDAWDAVAGAAGALIVFVPPPRSSLGRRRARDQEP